jgi:hypothetical protein
VAGEIHLAEHQAGHGAVDQKIVPLDGGPDRAGDDGAAQRPLMLGLRHRRKGGIDRSHGITSPFFYAVYVSK